MLDQVAEGLLFPIGESVNHFVVLGPRSRRVFSIVVCAGVEVPVGERGVDAVLTYTHELLDLALLHALLQGALLGLR